MSSESSKSSKSSDMDIILLLDKEKLPEDIRNKLPVDIQEKLIDILKERDYTPKDSTGPYGQQMFAIQTGTVIGNIYKDDIQKIMNHDIDRDKINMNQDKV